MAIIAVVLMSALLIMVVAIALYLVSGGTSRRERWEEQSRIIFWDCERAEGQRPD